MPSAPTSAGATADASTALEYAVLGTALYESVVIALRRLAHQHVAARLLRRGEAETSSP